jgi:hypothetical protein
MAISKAQDAPKVPKELRWSTFLSGSPAAAPAKEPATKRSPAKKSAPKKAAKSAGPISPDRANS